MPQLELGGSLGLLRTQYRGFVQNALNCPIARFPTPDWQAASMRRGAILAAVRADRHHRHGRVLL